MAATKEERVIIIQKVVYFSFTTLNTNAFNCENIG